VGRRYGWGEVKDGERLEIMGVVKGKGWRERGE